jgi:hypothetical protein
MNKAPLEYYKYLEFFTRSGYHRTHYNIPDEVIIAFVDAGLVISNHYLSCLTEAGEDAMMKYHLLK